MTQSLPLVMSSVTYKIKSGTLLQDINLTVASNESVAITGRSGVGKSTLLSISLGLVRPASGSVKVATHEITKLRENEIAKCRSANIGMVFQFGELIPELSPVENIALPALLKGIPREESYKRARCLMDELGLAQYSLALTRELSGGERQRVAVARALMCAPRLLLADEPTGSLDHESREQVADVLFRVPQERGCGLLIATHDLQVARRADRVLTLRDGRLAEV